MKLAYTTSRLAYATLEVAYATVVYIELLAMFKWQKIEE